MNYQFLLILISLLSIINCSYNPIPYGAVIVSTTKQVFAMKPTEYGGDDKLNVIYTAANGSVIVNTIFDSTARNLYILFINTTNSSSTNSNVYLCQLISVELLGSVVYQLPVTFSVAKINSLTSFTSDVVNKRAFLTDQSGTVTMFSLSGAMNTIIQTPLTYTNLTRSVAYNSVYNRLFFISDSAVDSCSNLDTNNLQCCQALPKTGNLRTITFDSTTSDMYAYVVDQTTGVYQVVLNSTGCPTALRPINTLGTENNLQLVINNGFYFASGSAINSNDNSFLVIVNGTQTPRKIPVNQAIVALHISALNTDSPVQLIETCFHGITYNDYRIAVVLAAIFGTIMGIFMCFNALFCIDFFMTKSIIRDLKQQIPHNLLEDRWNRLVEEKYAKIALEKQRKQDDPPPARRKSSLSRGRKTSSAATAGSNNNNSDQTTAGGTGGDNLQVPNPIPAISAYLRRKSESYLNRRRSDDYRTQRQQQQQQQQQPLDESSEARAYPPQRGQMASPRVHIETVTEENENQRGLRQNLSRKELLTDNEDFL